MSVDGVVDERRGGRNERRSPEPDDAVVDPAGGEIGARDKSNAGSERHSPHDPNGMAEDPKPEVGQERVEDLVVGPVVRPDDVPDGPERVLLKRRRLVPA